jgi:hypothetical protein
MAEETYRQASAEFDETPPFDSDEVDDEGDADAEFGGGDDEENEGVD